MTKLFALLVGIKDYHPASGVSSLTGCVNDVNAMEAYLHDKFKPENRSIVKLLNDQATRQGFIDGFIAQFIKNPNIQAGDILVFYYSGHGSYATSHPDFSDWDSDRQDETLVLYDSRLKDSYDLVDKELRLLLSAVPAKAHTIVILDSCHSGSATRDVDDLDAILLGKPKHAPTDTRENARPLETYFSIDGFDRLRDTSGKIAMPAARYLVLGACDRYEVAYEDGTNASGIFTTMLLRALSSGQQNLTYAKLYEHLYNLLRSRARKQTPQLDIAGGYDPNTIVFGTTTALGPAKFSIRYDEGPLIIDCGSLHGLKNDRKSMQRMLVNVIDPEQPELPAVTTRIRSVGIDRSELVEPNGDVSGMVAAIINLPPAITILLSGDSQQSTRWTQLAKTRKKENLAFITDDNGHHDYTVIFSPSQIRIVRSDNNQLIHGVAQTSDDAIEYLIACCNQITFCHQLRDMKNYALAGEALEDIFQTQFGLELIDRNTGAASFQPDDEIIVYLNDNTPFVRTHLSTGSTQGWYCGVYYMSSRFALTEITTNGPEARLYNGHSLAGLQKKNNPGIPAGLEETTDYLTLIISEKPFRKYLIPNYSKLETTILPTAPPKERARDLDDTIPIDQTWFAKTIRLRIKRGSAPLNAQRGFTQGAVSISQHNTLSATVSLSPLSSGAKDPQPAAKLIDLIRESGYEPLNLDNTRSTAQEQNIIWLDNIEGKLEDKPLELSIAAETSDTHELMALTMVDGVVQIIGIAEPKDRNSYAMTISTLPEDNRQRKSLLRAAWFCLVKVLLKKDLSKLRLIDYNTQKPPYSDRDIKDMIQPGTKAAVLIHGIIGNTKGMAEAMRFLVDEKHYDMLLAFDYENLNGEIEDMADVLQTKLRDAGACSGAKVDIICHSMGGLVSRYMIEQLDADAWIGTLYMFGTPNAGSVFGEIPKIRDWAVSLLTVACNLGKHWLGHIGVVLEGVNKTLAATRVATHSLAQMADDSKFYKQLNKPQPGKILQTKYHIIAGNVLEFEPGEDDGRFHKLVEALKKQAGKWAYSSTTQNDIAVSTESILTVPREDVTSKEIIPCHHLNYFEVDASLNHFKKLIENN